jgi:UDP-N-acetylglucosamine acyltransferase
MKVHPTAIVEDGAIIGEGVEIGPYCRIGPKVKIGPDCVFQSHVVVSGATEIGPRTVVHPFAALGGPPQHLAYRGEETRLVIGADCIIREYATMNLGAPAGRGVTTVGDRGYFMAGSHVGHDCIVGEGAIFANCATLGGHVVVGERAFLGGLCAVHQRCRIGAFAFLGGCAAVVTDVIPYASAAGNHARLIGLNIVGLKRQGMPRETIHALRGAYKTLFGPDGAFRERVQEVERRFGAIPEVARILEFVKADADRPLMTPA